MLTKEEIIEGNIKIAKWLGWDVRYEDWMNRPENPFMRVNVVDINGKVFTSNRPEEDLDKQIKKEWETNAGNTWGWFGGFECKWEKLMPLIERINSDGYAVTIHRGCVDIVDTKKAGYKYITNNKGDEETYYHNGEIIEVNATDDTSFIELVWTACLEFCEYIDKKNNKN